MQRLKWPDQTAPHQGAGTAWLLSLLGCVLWICLHAPSALGQTPPALGQETDRILLIGGNYRMRGILHNMQGGYFGAPSISDDKETQRFLDTRLRLSFDIRPHPMIRLNYQFEIGDITFGANNAPIIDDDGRRLENIGGGTGGEAGSDGVNLETKNAYIDIQIPRVPGLSFRGGIIGWGDQFDWTILSTDFTGLQLTYQRDPLWTQFTYLKFAEGSLRDSDDSDWFAFDTRYAFSPRTTLSGSLYFWNDDANDNPLTGDDAHQFYAGLKFNTVFFGKGLFELSGVFNMGQDFLGQAQNEGPSGLVRGGLTGSRNRGFMANLHADYPLGNHWLGLTLQYISGESGSRTATDGSGRDIDGFVGLFNQQYSGFGRSRFTDGGGLELITLGHINGSTAGLNNVSVSPFFGGSYNGRLLGVLRTKFRATPVLFFYAAMGLDMAAEKNVNGDRLRGLELNTYLHWDIMPKLWLRTGTAYMFTGDWWKDNPDVALQGFPNPAGLQSQGSVENIFQFMVRLQYDFG